MVNHSSSSSEYNWTATEATLLRSPYWYFPSFHSHSNSYWDLWPSSSKKSLLFSGFSCFSLIFASSFRQHKCWFLVSRSFDETSCLRICTSLHFYFGFAFSSVIGSSGLSDLRSFSAGMSLACASSLSPTFCQVCLDYIFYSFFFLDCFSCRPKMESHQSTSSKTCFLMGYFLHLNLRVLWKMTVWLWDLLLLFSNDWSRLFLYSLVPYSNCFSNQFDRLLSYELLDW